MLDSPSRSGPLRVVRKLNSAVQRSFDAAEANRIINDPSVFPDVALPGTKTIDLAPIVAEPANVLMMAEGGAILFLADMEPGVYNVHTAFLKDFRGDHAVAASREAYRWMFTNTNCWILQTQIPAFNKPAAMAANAVGFERAFERKNVWPTDEKGGLCDLYFYEMPLDAWMHNAAPELIESGKQFHITLDAERARLGHKDIGIAGKHPDEDCHDLRAGACLEMVYGGQPVKAVVLYNRWARFAGYGQISLLQEAPLVIDIGDAVLVINDKSFKVIKVR